MKTIICQKPAHLSPIELPMPEVIPGSALVRMKRLGICGTDLHAFAGRQPFFSYPRVLGHELSGEVAEINARDTSLKQGDTVAVIPYLECGQCVACRAGRTNCCVDLTVLGVHQDGGMSEYIVVPHTHLIKNNTLAADHLALAECYAIGAHAVRRAAIREGEHVLVVGAGPIGLGIMQFAAISGGRVAALDVSAERLSFVSEHLTGTQTVNPADGDVREQLETLTGGDYPTVIFDATGNRLSMQNNLYYLAHGGRYVLVGLITDDICFSDPEFHKRETTLMGSRNALKDDFLWVLQCMGNGSLACDAMITHRSSFADLLDNFSQWTRPESRIIKAIVEF
jgi:2-desacetyl-2-hydroxyethyl bacteriochlorophyllide A dehydrogenase